MSIADPSALDNFTPADEEPMQGSYSSLTLHRKCAQAWYYRHALRIERDQTPSPYLTMGRWWSALRAVEAINRGAKAGTLIEQPRDLKDGDEGYRFKAGATDLDDVYRAAERRWGGLTRDEQDLFISTLGASLPERLRGMYGLWDTARADRHTREQPLAVEMFWKRALPRPENDRAWSLLADPAAVPQMNLIGFIDYVYFDRERGIVVIQDDKAPNSLSNTTSTMDDIMDSQLQLYAWGAAPKLRRLGAPAARAVAYDRTRSVQPKEPKLTATGTLSASITDYDLSTYRAWAQQDTRPSDEDLLALSDDPARVEELRGMRDGLGPGQFWGKLGEFYVSGAKKGQPKFGIHEIDQKKIDLLSGETESIKWHKRTVKPISQALVRSHLRSAVDTALDIWQTQTRAEVTGEGARNLDRFGCARCDYAELCRAQLLGGAGGDYDLESFGLRIKPVPTRSKNGDANDG